MPPIPGILIIFENIESHCCYTVVDLILAKVAKWNKNLKNNNKDREALFRLHRCPSGKNPDQRGKWQSMFPRP